MTTNTTHAIPTKRVLTAALLAVAAVSSGAALGDAALASADPSKSVRDGYAACVNKVPTTDPGWEGNVTKCCLEAGGTFVDGPDARGCQLPEADRPNSPGPARTAIIPSQITGATSLK
jgi:hypothetical protein